jgi:hypothetical protein
MAIVDEYRAYMKARASTTPAELEEMKQTEDWLAIRKEEGLRINPDTAEVYWEMRMPADPYEVHTDLCEEEKQTGRVYFARNPGSDIWVCFDDMPTNTRAKLWKRHRKELAFPAGMTLTPVKPVSARGEATESDGEYRDRWHAMRLAMRSLFGRQKEAASPMRALDAKSGPPEPL